VTAPRPSAGPTLDDVARVAGVSRATASRVINGKRKVAPALQELVQSAVAATGYSPHRAARTLVTRRTGSVALVISGTDPETDPVTDPGSGGSRYAGHVFDDPFFGRIVAGIVRALRPHDVHPVLMLAEDDVARAQVVSYVRQGNADGVLHVSTRADDPLPALLVEVGRPAVLFARPSAPLPISFVDLANRDGGALAAEHFVADGRTAPAAIAGPLGVLAASDRLAGFRDALARRGHAYVPSVEGNFTIESGDAAMRALLEQVPGVDAVFAGNDLMAQGAIDVLHESGRRVPEDVAVVGFDDTALAQRARPAPTTVRQPVEEMAGEMVRLLLERIEDPTLAVRSVLFEPTLVVRGSA
jgi:DNA-binding LacI/PurR family transcriptional regulator